MQRNPSSAKSKESSSWIYSLYTWLQFQFLLLQYFLHRFSDHSFPLEGFLRYIASFRWFWPSICFPKPSMSCDYLDSTIQESFPHKYSQRVWRGAINVVVASIPLDMTKLTSSLKPFLYSVTSSSNMPLTWSRLTFSTWPSKDRVFSASTWHHWP